MHFPIHIIFLVFLLPSQIATFECGIPYFPFTKASNESAGHQFKISNGDRVLDNAKYPWMAAFFRNDQKCCQNMQFCYCCSASIIGPRHIILAAHCIPSKEEAVEHTQIRLGNVNYLSEEIIKPTIKRILVHPEFNSRTLNNDIAIIELANPLNFSEQIRPICLAKEFDETKYGTIGWDGAYQANMIIAGWGHQHEDYSQPDLIPEILREGMAHPIALDECKIKIGPLDEKIICMGMEMIGQKRQIAEKGDSGGPAFLWKESDNGNGRRQRRYTQVGVSSFKVSYSNKDPVAYTRISAFCDWIGESTSGEIKCI